MDKKLLSSAWISFRSRLAAWLFLALACVPFTFTFFIGYYDYPSLLISLLGLAIAFALVFLFWCLASYIYWDDNPSSSAQAFAVAKQKLCSQWNRFLNLSILMGLIISFGFFIAGFIVGNILTTLLLAIFMRSGESVSLGITIYIISYYVPYLSLALVMTFFSLAPQLAGLETSEFPGTDNAMGVLGVSYNLIKKRYRRAVGLYMIPELAARTIILGLIMASRYFPQNVRTFIPLLILMSLAEGGRTAFIAAGFNALYEEIIEEERARKKSKKGDKKKQSAKGSPSPHKKKK